MGQGVVLTLQIIQFCMDWIVATVVAVSWCYTFKMSWASVSETLLGWSLYTLFLIVSLPFMQSVLMQQMKNSGKFKKDDNITLQGWRYMLSITCGTVITTALAGLAAQVFPGFKVTYVMAIGVPSGLIVALPLTILAVSGQSYMEWLVHVGLPSYSKDGWLKCMLVILLSALYGTLGYIWNGVWDKLITELTVFGYGTGAQANIMVAPPNITVAPPNITVASREISARTLPALSSLQSVASDRFETINDMMLGTTLALKWKFYKAAIVTGIAVAMLYFVPQAPPVGERRWLTRNWRLSTQMVTLWVSAYATTDAGYDFGMEYVKAITGDTLLGLAVAYLYTVVLSVVVCAICCVCSFDTRTDFQKWMFLLACYWVSTAWWYVWQETLCQIQGYGISDVLAGHWWKHIVFFTIAVFQNLLLTLLWVLCVKYASRFAVEHAKREATSKGEELDLKSALKSATVTDSFRFLAVCSGVDLSSVDEVRPDEKSSYGADATSGAEPSRDAAAA